MLKNKNFLLLLGSQLFSIIGTTVIQFSISLYVLDVTNSAFLFSVITALSMAGRIACLPICGILADRLPKRRLMIIMDFSYLVFSLLLLMVSQMNQAVLLIGILTVLMGMVSAFETPVVQSAIPLLCSEEEVPRANSAISSIGLMGNILGPVLAGIVYQLERINQVFIICGCLFLLAVVCEGLLKIPVLRRETQQMSVREMLVADTREVADYLKQKVVILQICFVAFLLNLFLSSFTQVMVPYIARIQMGVSSEEYGLMNTIFAVGGLLGTIIYGTLASKFANSSISKFLIFISLLFCTLIIPIGLMSNSPSAFWLMVGIVAIILGSTTLVSMQLVVYIQLITDKLLLGRVMSFVMISASLATPLGQVMYGAIGSLMSGGTAVLIIGILTIVTLIIAVYSRRVFLKMDTKPNPIAK